MVEGDLLFELRCLQKGPARKRFRKDILEGWEHRCAYCHRERATTLDHVVPKSRGGPTTKANLVACCGDCNISKNHENVLAWWRAQTFWTSEREHKLFLWLSKYHPATISRAQELDKLLGYRGLPPAAA